MIKIVLFASIFAMLGLIAGLNIEPTPSVSQPLSINHPAEVDTTVLLNNIRQLQSRIEQLEEQLNQEITTQKQTQIQLANLDQTISQLQNTRREKEKLEKEINPALISQNVNEPAQTESEKNKKILLGMGISEESASRIQRLAEKKEMEQLYLRNTAVREGWFGTEKYFEKTRELDLSSNIYRDQLGDEKYDQFLYESQLTNRIKIQSVLSESPAEAAGLQADDYILSYGNQRVFNWSDLTYLTANGENGENVPIEIQRNGQIFQYFIPRGPLGIRLVSERIPPNLP